MIAITDETLRHALASYTAAFGHGVPDAVVTMFAARPGPLVAEIRQAVRLSRPVPGWREHAKRGLDTSRVL